MNRTSHTDDDQAMRWSGQAGRAWVEAQQVLDQMFQPLEDMLMEAIRTSSGVRVLDVGCGTGSTTLAAARSAGTQGRCVGIDISDPMIVAARKRAEKSGSSARFICADAQIFAFEPASFDLIISRFGVMFFDDPVRAFAILRHAARTGAGLRLVAWRGAAENPFMTTAEHAAAPLLPNIPARVHNAPGQFAFADPQRVCGILKESGWTDIEIRPIDVSCALPERDLDGYLIRLGPVGRALEEVDEQTWSRVVDKVRAAFEPYVSGVEVRFDAACWIIEAQVPSSSATAQ